MRVNGVGGSGDSSMGMGRDSSASIDSLSVDSPMNIGLDRTALRSMAFWTGDLMSEPGESVSYTGLDSTDSTSVVGGGVFASSCVEGSNSARPRFWSPLPVFYKVLANPSVDEQAQKL